jgi:hypothetical protein
MQVLPGDMLVTAPPLPAPVHELVIMGYKGDDERITWDQNDPAQIEAASATFTELHSAGYMAYKLNASAGGEVLRAFDPSAETIVLQPQMVGG